MKYPIVKTKNKIFGNLGIAWAFPIIVVWKRGPHVDQTIRHEEVHMRQWIEVWTLTAPLIALVIEVNELSWWFMALVYPSYWAVYALLHNALERDARIHANRLASRAKYAWRNLI